ncbi:MAG: helix-turn-helix transcriptional regulator [Mucilaginibacter sp.]
MKLHTFRPPVSIASYVSSIVVLQDDKLDNDCIIPLIAKGMPSIVFQVTGQPAKNKNSNLVLYGQNLKPFEFYAADNLTIIAYFLHPHILSGFFGLSANEITGLCVDLSQFSTAREINLKEQLLNAPTLQSQLELMNNYILQLSGNLHADINPSITYAVDTIQHRNGLASLRGIQDELRVTERTLQRLFNFHIGVSPKTFSKICQFNSAFQQLSSGQFSKLGDIAYQNGYADQSHLIRVFKEFTNLSPKEYLKEIAPFQD